MVARLVGAAVVVFVGTAGAYDADAQTWPVAPSVRVATGQWLQTSPTPWEQLFRVQPSDDDARRLAKQARRERLAEADERPPCTMPIVEVTADLDAHMVMPLPEDQPPPRMPVIEPSCRPRNR